MTDSIKDAERHRADLSWRDRFVLEARLQELPGSAIGDALAEVDAHCAQVDQGPAEAFGEPETYAATLAEAVGRQTTASALTWPTIALVVAGVTGWQLLAEGTAAVADRRDASLGPTQCLLVVVASAAAALVVHHLDTVLRRPRLGAVLASLATLPVVATAVLLSVAPDQPGLAAPAWPTIVVGAIAALAPLVSIGRSVTNPAADVEIVDPRTGDRPYPARRWLTLALLAAPLALGATILGVLALA